jgi:subfamily B ATP-binding cassette protein MsbA
MRHAFKILSFGWSYLRNYRLRLALGLLCGLLYAFSNGGFVWATRALTEHFSPPENPASLITQPQSQTISPGNNVTFTVTAVGTPPLAYQWLLNGTNAIGVNTNTYSLTNIQSTDAGNYSVVVMSVAGNSTSSNASLIVSDSPLAAKPILPHRALSLGSIQRVNEALKRSLDPWLPCVGTPVTWRHLVGLLLFLPLLAFLRGAMDYLNNYCMGWSSERAVRDMRLDIMEKLSTLSLDFFTRSTTGDLLTRINSDTQTLLRSLRAGAPDLIKESATLVVVFAVLCGKDYKLTLAAMVILPLVAIPLVILGKKARLATRARRTVDVSQSNQLVELLGGIRVIKAFNLEKEEIERFRKSSKKIVRAGMKNVQAKELIGPVIEVASAIGLGLLLLYIFYSKRDMANLPAFVIGFLFFFQSIKKLAAVHILFEQAHISVDRLMNILGEKPKVCDPPNPRPFKEFKSGITLEGVSFGYLEKQVLRDVQLTIPRGFKLGIAGASGSGKTTLVNLLFRFYDPTRGAVKIDGLDLREIAVRDLRQQMALVSQDVIVFDQTIAENIAAGKLGASRAEIEAAARAAFAHDFITQLPEGYDTRVGERGVTLSGGQRQRIAIARAFVRNAPILVLDEATASLDSKAEGEVQAAIDRLAEHRTVICVAHRLSTLAAMDRVIVLSEGRIIESGRFEELLATGSVFAGMAARQGMFASSPHATVETGAR